jgi:CubicO group peptidase (beta-lactamase class C family)
MARLDIVEKSLVQEMNARKVPGFSVAVVDGTSIAWSKGFGYSNIERKIPTTPETVYRVASVSKPVIATGLLQWMDRGKFRLDDPVNKFLGNVKIQTKFKEQPTFRNILSHTSGLPIHVDPVCFELKDAVPLEEMIRKSAIAVLPPKREIVYSNTAFNIVGYLVGQFAGEPYPVYMKKDIFDPLKMDSSAFEQSPKIRDMMAQPYSRNKPEDPIDKVRPWYAGSNPEKPCGSLFSSVTDLSKFLIAQMNAGVYEGHRVLRESTVQEMHKLQARAGTSRSGYALSWKLTWHYGRLMLSHTGGNLGWTAHVAFYPELKLGIVILCNLNDNSGWRPPAENSLYLLVGGTQSFDPHTMRTEVASKQERLTGIYSHEFQRAQVKLKENFPVLERGSAEAYLEKLDETRYLVHGGASDGKEFTFEFDGKGIAKQFDLETETYTRYSEDKRPIDEDADLTGVWRAEYVHPHGYFTMKLRIESQTSALVTDMDGNMVQVMDFKADRGKVGGNAKFKVLPEYAGWGADELQVTLSLAAIQGKLEGYMNLRSRIGESKVPLILTKAG